MYYDMMNMPYRLRETVDREVGRDEKIEWLGQPRSTRFLLTSLPMVLFGLPWTAFAVFWMLAASGFVFEAEEASGPGAIFALFGLPFVLVGLGMLSSPFWMIRKARRIVYVVSDRRAIIIRGGWRTTVRSFSGRELSGMTRLEKSDGSGDIVFHGGHSAAGAPSFLVGMAAAAGHGFAGVQNVREVEELLRKLVEKDRPSEDS
ncbi:MAG: hypothetical protein ACYS9X_30860 [Planctomycetota bacterium]|jgi:hypothetical protein